MPSITGSALPSPIYRSTVIHPSYPAMGEFLSSDTTIEPNLVAIAPKSSVWVECLVG
jgi:hypothetical protein